MKQFDIKNILVPVDFSENSIEALNHAVYVAKLNKASITVLNVTEAMMTFVTQGDFPASFAYDLETYEKTVFTQSKKQLS